MQNLTDFSTSMLVCVAFEMRWYHTWIPLHNCSNSFIAAVAISRTVAQWRNLQKLIRLSALKLHYQVTINNNQSSISPTGDVWWLIKVAYSVCVNAGNPKLIIGRCDLQRSPGSLNRLVGRPGRRISGEHRFNERGDGVLGRGKKKSRQNNSRSDSAPTAKRSIIISVRLESMGRRGSWPAGIEQNRKRRTIKPEKTYVQDNYTASVYLRRLPFWALDPWWWACWQPCRE